jgi:hypothetical protein
VGGGSLYLGALTAAANLLYVGPGEVVTRTLGLSGTTGVPTLDASGSGPVQLTSVANTGAGGKTLTLRGFNTDLNLISGTLGDNGGALSVAKWDGGVWVLAPTAGANSFTGGITVNSGLLGLTTQGLGTASSLTLAGGGLFAFGGGPLNGGNLTLANTGVNSNTGGLSSFTGAGSITFGTLSGQSANNWQFNNLLENGAVLTFNKFVNLDTTNSRTLNVRGYGSTVFAGTLSDANGVYTTALDIRVGNSASLTLSGSSPMRGGVALYQGILLLDNPAVSAGSSVLGAGTSTFSFGGGELRSNYAMTGASALLNPVSIVGDPALVSGTSSLSSARAARTWPSWQDTAMRSSERPTSAGSAVRGEAMSRPG